MDKLKEQLQRSQRLSNPSLIDILMLAIKGINGYPS
jgi:hypothetical protein